jgi:Fe-S cluster assembly protein SufD
MIAQQSLEQENFKNLLEKLRSQNLWDNDLERVRLKAWQHFVSLGLPSRQNEVYRCIKLRSLFSQSFQLANTKSLIKEQIQSWIYPECKHSVIVFVNGFYDPHLSCLKALPKKVVVSSLQEAAQAFGALLNNYWSKSLKEEGDPFAVLNGAMHRQGAFLYLPPNTVVEAPIQILHIVDHEDGLPLLMPRLQVFVGPRSEIRLIDTQKNVMSGGYFVNQVTELVLDEGAHVSYTQVLCDEHPQGWHFDAFRATLKKDSVLKTVCVTKGSLTVRNDYKIILTGENAEVFLNGLLMLDEKQEAHTNVMIDHQAPHCRSSQLFKGALAGFSRSSFEGKIMVRQAAQKTEAFQLNNNLLLNDHAHADSKPNLEIFADDVKASHGATVGQLDPEQLFYMRARGFSDEEAKNCLIYGFCEQVIEQIQLPSLKEEISSHARNYLRQGKSK